MNKQEFVANLRAKLCGLPTRDIEERIDFYIEIIDDRVEDGRTEEDAIAEIGSVEEIAAQILESIPLSKLAKEKIKQKRSLGTWEIVLLVLGAPIWLSLGLAAVAVILSLYVSVWSVIVSLWAVFGSLVACSFAWTVCGIAFAVGGKGVAGLLWTGAGVFGAGLSIFFFFGCKAATKGVVWLTKKMVLGLKKSLLKKEEA